MTDELIREIHFGDQFLMVPADMVTQATELLKHPAYVINIGLATFTKVRGIGMSHDPSRFVADRALEDGCKQFQLELKFIHAFRCQFSTHRLQ